MGGMTFMPFVRDSKPVDKAGSGAKAATGAPAAKPVTVSELAYGLSLNEV